MAATLELTDGTTTLNLRGTTYNAGTGSLGIPPPPVQLALAGNSLSRQTYGPREISMTLVVTGSSVSNLETVLRNLDNMLAVAAERQFFNQSTIKLKTQVGETDANDVEYRVLRGSHFLPSTILNAETLDNNKVSISGRLSLLVEPLGRLAQVTLTQVTLENEQDGNNNNFVDIEGAFGAYLSFDAINDIISCGSDSSMTNIYDSGGTFEAMVYAKSDGEGNVGRIFSKGAVNELYVSGESGGKVKLTFVQTFDSDDGQWTTSAAVLPINEWHRVTVTYNSSSPSNNPDFQIDGVTQGTVGNGLTEDSTPTGTRDSDTGIVMRLGNNSGQTATWDGFLDDIRMWSDTRTDTEIDDNAQKELVGNEGGLVAYWPTNDSTGTVVVDHSSNTNDGTITGATWTIGGRPLGTEGARLQIKVSDPGGTAWSGSKKMWFWKHSGARRTDNLFIQGEAEAGFTQGTNPFDSGGAVFSSDGADSGLSNASGGQASRMTWTMDTNGAVNTSSFSIIGRTNYDITTLPKGIFRVLVRVQFTDTITGTPLASEVGFARGYSYGGTTYTPVVGDFKAVAALATWATIDLGEIVIPPTPTPDGYTDATYQLRIHAIQAFGSGHVAANTQTLNWYIDYIILAAFDEGFVAVDAVAAADRVLIDGLSENPGVHILNSSDVVQQAAVKVGGPWDSGPEPWRLYWARDDVGDPSDIKANIDIQHTPQVIGI